ncbi:YtxH domain-containing protein [Halalkalibacter alkaliphilus]|uniref:YtxH domain-containing protein n=1 Tax=Halalkalibacter alkaliphilus TaxID=2917993 RepID=A0A9X2CRJ5_9BACI|nr:YtxH domain-containing protein [Halalkalibacter alkaliphilus]MCL7746279.1 YtxH domain-containing protein [Halalkalibacter alkaliphilus]
MFKKSKPSTSSYIVSSIVGGAIGAAGVMFLNSERGQQFRKEMSNQMNQPLSETLVEMGKEWADFGDVVDARTKTSENDE